MLKAWFICVCGNNSSVQREQDLGTKEKDIHISPNCLPNKSEIIKGISPKRKCRKRERIVSKKDDQERRRQVRT